MNSFRNKRLLDDLVRNRNRSNKEIDAILKGYEARARRRPKTLKGVRNGNYFRINLPPRQNVPEVPKLPSPTGPAPKPLQSLPPKVEQASAASMTTQQQAGNQERIRYSFGRMWEFLKLNGPVLIMNAGSFCTLLAFTRTDVLQLRALSVAGSACFILYTVFTPPIKWLSVGWTSLFASVNSWKIVGIVNERHSTVDMTPECRNAYGKYFEPHGITPKQFELIADTARRFKVKKNEPLVKQGQRLDHVYLVVEGSTRASILGRYLTAASTSTTQVAQEEKEKEKEGGNSGAWVGEMAFLEVLWEKEQGKDESDGPSRSGTAMYTVVAKEDCIVWAWSHDKMERLLARSSDMRTALTRAMTSAIVGKVINFTVSRTSARPSWQTWLDDWKLARAQATTASYAPATEEEEVQANVGKDSPA